MDMSDPFDQVRLFEVKTPQLMDDAVLFSIVNFPKIIEKVSKYGISSLDIKISERQETNLKHIIEKFGGEVIGSNPSFYEYEIPLALPSSDEDLNRSVVIAYNKYLEDKGKQRELFHSTYVFDSINQGRRVDLNQYKYTQLANSEYEPYDANEIAEIKRKWSTLKRIEKNPVPAISEANVTRNQGTSSDNFSLSIASISSRKDTFEILPAMPNITYLQTVLPSSYAELNEKYADQPALHLKSSNKELLVLSSPAELLSGVDNSQNIGLRSRSGLKSSRINSLPYVKPKRNMK